MCVCASFMRRMCVSQRIPPDCHRQLIGKIEAISLRRVDRIGPRVIDHWTGRRQRRNLHFQINGLCEHKVWKYSETLIGEFLSLFSFSLLLHSSLAHIVLQVTNHQHCSICSAETASLSTSIVWRNTLNSWFPLGDTSCWCYNLRACRWQQLKPAKLSFDCCAAVNRLRGNH